MSKNATFEAGEADAIGIVRSYMQLIVSFVLHVCTGLIFEIFQLEDIPHPSTHKLT
jgi:hypothetical protein